MRRAPVNLIINEESSPNIMSPDSLSYKHGRGVTVITGKGPSMKRVTAPSPSAVARFELKVSRDVIAASQSHLSKPGRLRSGISCRWEGIWPPVILSHLHRYRRRAVTGRAAALIVGTAPVKKEKTHIHSMYLHCFCAHMKSVISLQQEHEANG